MSHTTTYEMKITDIKLFCEVCKNAGHNVLHSEAGNLTVNHYNRNTVSNCAAQIHMKDWRFPLAIKANGEVMYDHWGSKPQTMDHLRNAFEQYNVALVMKNMDMTKVENYYFSTNDQGEKVLTMEYA